MARDRTHRAINLYREEQIYAIDNAFNAAKREVGEDATAGELLREIAASYTGDEEYW